MAPTPSPTKVPTTGPSFSACRIDYELDVVVVVAHGCAQTEQECSDQQRLASDLVENFYSDRVNLGYLAFDSDGVTTTFELDDAPQNKVRSTIIETIRSETCMDNVDSTFDAAEAIEEAIDMFREQSPPEAVRKLVIITACSDDDEQEVCDKEGELDELDVDVIVLNLGDLAGMRTYSCLAEDVMNELVVFPNYSPRTPQVTTPVVEAADQVCEKPTPAPTDEPSPSPTPRPIWWRAETPRPTWWKGY